VFIVRLEAFCFYSIASKYIEVKKASQDETYLHPKEPLITDFLMETVKFNQENASGLSSGNKCNEGLDEVFRVMIIKIQYTNG
jgi:hypothetical protein